MELYFIFILLICMIQLAINICLFVLYLGGVSNEKRS